MLDEARMIGLERVLLVCEPDNIASATVIEQNGGARDDTPETDQLQPRRYWINVRDHSPRVT
jgi:predicted acetyltransferase